MSASLSALLATCRSPADLMALGSVAPPSPAIACALRAVYAQRPTPEDRALWPGMSRTEWPATKPRRVAGAIGRRGLKTSGIVAWCAVYEALCGGHEAHAAQGSRIYFVVICPLVAQAREAVRGIRAVLDQLAALGVRYALRDAAGAPEIVVTSPRGRCERVLTVMTADAVAVRGFAIPFVAFDEAGFLPFEDVHAVRDRDIVRAVSPAQVQFPGALSLFVSSPGAPGSLFHALVEKPPRGTLVMRAPSWITNPRITEAMCLAEAAGDVAAFEQEYAARRFGYAGESYIETRAIVVGDEATGKGPRPGSFVVAFDVGQTTDETAIAVCSMFEVEIDPRHAPVKHVVCEHLETMQGSRRAPIPIEAIASRVVALSRAYGHAPILSDRFAGPTTAAELVKLGVREHWDDDERVPPPGTFCQRSMAPERQTPRWKAVRELAHGARLHVPAGEQGEKLRAQLAGLHATQLSSGALKVEGRRDDLADCLALAVPVALKLPPTDGPTGRVVFVPGTLTWDEEGLTSRGSHYVRELPNGRSVPAEVPRWDPYFEDYAREQIAAGIRTPAIVAWEQEQQQGQPRGVNVPVAHEGAPTTAPARGGFGWGPGSSKSSRWAFGGDKDK